MYLIAKAAINFLFRSKSARNWDRVFVIIKETIGYHVQKRFRAKLKFLISYNVYNITFVTTMRYVIVVVNLLKKCARDIYLRKYKNNNYLQIIYTKVVTLKYGFTHISVIIMSHFNQNRCNKQINELGKI